MSVKKTSGEPSLGPASEQDWETLEQWDNEPKHRHALARLRQEMEMGARRNRWLEDEVRRLSYVLQTATVDRDARIDALEAENERLRKIEKAARTVELTFRANMPKAQPKALRLLRRILKEDQYE
jgi:hypothetical protein